MDGLIFAVLALLAIAGATALEPRLGIAAPLVLVAVGVVASLFPFVPDVEVEPEWILTGVLPPLLYSASRSMPTMDFRREFRPIAGLSVLLVVASAFILGAFFSWAIPGVDFVWGIALGAIISPTDAVATAIARRLGVSGRIITVLEGESLLNDATALVLLRTAIAGSAASVSLGGALGDFVFAVAAAVAIGFVAGHLDLAVRSRVADPTVNTVISFAAPFIASIPAEELGASGLVAAVMAGLVTSQDAPRRLSPRHRLSDTVNWRTIALVLEGGLFLLMGLELSDVVADVRDEHEGVGKATAIAAGALALTVLVRAAYVAPLLAAVRRRAARGARLRPKIAAMHERLSDPQTFTDRPERRRPTPARIESALTRIRRLSADIEFFLREPLGWREGAVIVWAGMRGAVTIAAAQTLPGDAPNRSLLVFVAFAVAVASLVLQGGTLAWVISAVKPAQPDPEAAAAERREIQTLLAAAAATVPAGAGEAGDLAVIEAQRTAMLDARDDGRFSARELDAALVRLDAEQIGIELRRSDQS